MTSQRRPQKVTNKATVTNKYNGNIHQWEERGSGAGTSSSVPPAPLPRSKERKKGSQDQRPQTPKSHQQGNSHKQVQW